MTNKWYRRWRKIGYKELWHLHFGGAHEGDKGCEREYNFLLEVMSGWKGAYENEVSLRLKAEKKVQDCDHVQGGEIAGYERNERLTFTYCPKCGVKL